MSKVTLVPDASWTLVLVLIATAVPVEAFDVWIGSAPFCKSNPSHCHLFDLKYIRSDPAGTGSKCSSGTKVLCQPNQLSSSLKDTPRNDLVIVVYNVFESPFSESHNGQSERTCHIPRALLNQLPELDVLVFNGLYLGGCMQSGQGDRTVSIVDLLRLYGFLHATTILGESNKAFYSSNGGTMIVSRWPIQFQREIIFSNYGGSDRLVNRGAMYARLNKHKVVYHIIGTHLQEGGSDRDTIRVDQAKEVEAFISNLDLPLTEPVVIAGDFNSDRIGNKLHTQDILAALQAKLPMHIGSAQATYDYSSNELLESSQGEKTWLDYVAYSVRHMQPSLATMEALQLKADTGVRFCSRARMQPYYVLPDSAMCGKVTETKDLSDHFPVIGRLTFNDI